MIARKDDAIWQALGNSQEFGDALDTEVPPFAFNSGYGWLEIRRDEALALGVMARGDEIEPAALDVAVRDKARAGAVKNFDPELLASVRSRLAAKRAELDVVIARETAEDLAGGQP